MTTLTPGEDEPITLSQYAELTQRSIRSVNRDVKAGRIPAWKDPTIKRSKVTSLGAIRRIREAAAAKAEKAFMQKAKLT
jgi:hypothetical protein